MAPIGVSKQFEKHVRSVLDKENIVLDKDLDWGKTPLDQCFVLIISKRSNYFEVRLIVDEEHRDLELVHLRNVHENDVLIKKSFCDKDDAKRYVQEIRNKMVNGTFDDVHVRIRKLPSDVHSNPDRYINPGNHIQRDLGYPLIGNHEGVYLGEGRVAHINDKSSATGPLSLSTSKLSGDSCARIDRFERFAGDRSKEIRVLVHCIRRKTPEAICEDARRLAKCEYRKGEYHVLNKNCQHFASLCVIGEEWMSDKEELAITTAKFGCGVLAVGALAFMAYKSYNSEPEEDKQSSKKSKTDRR